MNLQSTAPQDQGSIFNSFSHLENEPGKKINDLQVFAEQNNKEREGAGGTFIPEGLVQLCLG